MELGVLTQHQDCRLEELLQRYKQEITPTKKGAVQERYRIDKLADIQLERYVFQIWLRIISSNTVMKERKQLQAEPS